MSPKAVFVREATGIVRSISPWQAFVTTVSVAGIGTGAASMYVFVPFVWPGADLALAAVLVVPFLLVHSAMYSMLAWSMPRSGGDYVWTGRILHPAVGMSINFTWLAYTAVLMGSWANYTVSYGMSSTLVSIGLVSRNLAIVEWGKALFADPILLTIVGTVLIAYIAVIQILGVQVYLKHQRVYWAIGIIGTVLAIGLLLGKTQIQYAAAFDRAMSPYATYQGIVDSAKSAGFVWGGMSVVATLGAMAYAWGANLGYQFSGYFSGELKQVRRAMFLSTMGNNVFCALFYAGFAWVFTSVVGYEWLHSLSYLAYGQPQAYNFPILPNPYFLASLLTDNAVVAGIINFSLVVWGPILIGSNWLAFTRSLLAMSFDRVLPTALADVSDRYHTPVKSIAVIAVVTWLGLMASLYYGVLFANMNFIFTVTIVFAIGAITAVVFPFRRKSMYEQTQIVRYKLAGVPLIVIAGIVSFFFFAYLAVDLGLNPVISGPTGPYATGLTIVCFIVSGLLYYAFRAYHKEREGIDIAVNFVQIPPE